MQYIGYAADLIIVFWALACVIRNAGSARHRLMHMIYASRIERLEREMNEIVEQAMLKMDLFYDSNVTETVVSHLAKQGYPPIMSADVKASCAKLLILLMSADIRPKLYQFQSTVHRVDTKWLTDQLDSDDAMIEGLRAELRDLGIDVKRLEAQM